MAEDNNGSATDSPIIIDMGKKKKKDIKRLRKGKGKLMSDVDNCIQELREAGEIITLSFFRERLKPDGLLLVSLPTENMLYRLGRRLAGFEGHYHQSNAASIHQQILDAGFHQLRMIKIPAAGPLAIYWAVAYRLTFAGRELEKFE